MGTLLMSAIRRILSIAAACVAIASVAHRDARACKNPALLVFSSQGMYSAPSNGVLAIRFFGPASDEDIPTFIEDEDSTAVSVSLRSGGELLDLQPLDHLSTAGLLVLRPANVPKPNQRYEVLVRRKEARFHNLLRVDVRQADVLGMSRQVVAMRTSDALLGCRRTYSIVARRRPDGMRWSGTERWVNDTLVVGDVVFGHHSDGKAPVWGNPSGRLGLDHYPESPHTRGEFWIVNLNGFLGGGSENLFFLLDASGRRYLEVVEGTGHVHLIGSLPSTTVALKAQLMDTAGNLSAVRQLFR